jgi:hypothetical protein
MPPLDCGAGIEESVWRRVSNSHADDDVSVFGKEFQNVRQRKEGDVNVVVANFPNGVARDVEQAGLKGIKTLSLAPIKI